MGVSETVLDLTERRDAVTLPRPRMIRLWRDSVVVDRRGSRLRRLDAQQVRRAVNVVAAVIGLVLAAPVMLIVAIAIRLTSPGPVIYRQTRVGIDRRNPNAPAGNWRRRVDYGGRLFTVYKFRTMVADADRGGQVWAQPGDPRVTRLGAMMRKYRLDELPQLWNVL
ncbi:MAG: sugar transferase, partial [Longimicrobiales bacterium]